MATGSQTDEDADEQPTPDTEDAHVQSNGVSEWKAPSLYRWIKRRRD